jgi:hypothetical protein
MMICLFKNVSRGRVKHEHAELATKAVKSRPSARPLGPTPGPPSRETDVPPSEDGVRGIAAYRETWPPSFTWQRQGASFEIVSLDVSAGEDVAFSHALPRCGTPESSSATPATGSG